jgi:porin
VVARRRVRHGVLAAVLIATLLTGGSVTAQLAAQVTNWPSAKRSDADVCGPELLDMGANTVDKAGSRWNGALPEQVCGISVAPSYCGEVFTNARGGISTNDATQYQALLDLPVTCDFEAMRLPLPGKFFLLGQHTHGRGLTDDFVGDTQVLSNIDSFSNITRVSEYWWEFEMLSEAVTVRLGKQDINDEFLNIHLAADFIQSSFGLSPSTAFPTYPDQSMGAVALLQLSESWRLKAGAWDSFAPGGGWGISSNDSVLAVGELERTYALTDNSLPGTFALGAVFEPAIEIEGDRVSPVQEYIFQIEQLIYREGTSDGGVIQGLGVFAGYYPRFPGPLIIDTSVGTSFVAGAVYTGLIPSRDEDVVGTGLAWTELFRGGTNHETVFEFFYKAVITPRVSLQPDLQYIASPSGIHRDAMAVGLRFLVTL